MKELFKNYFTYWDELPAGSGYQIFEGVHIAWLLGIAVFIAAFCVGFLRLGRRGHKNAAFLPSQRTLGPAQGSKVSIRETTLEIFSKSQNIILKSLAVLMLLMEIYKDLVLAATGHMELQYLPLHLCGLAIFIEAAFIFFPCTFLGELAATVCLPAALAALIFPDWLRYPTINFMNLHGFILHGLLVLIPLLIMLSGLYLPKIKNIWMPVAFLLACAVILYRVNIWLGTNFMFLNRPSNDSPFTAIYQAGGYVAYMLAFAAVALVLILVMYGVSAIIRRLRQPAKVRVDS